jgi:GT2 family glycosyltransferase
MLPILLVLRISGGSFWVRREIFLALGGFDERRRAFEDVDFILRLKRYARTWRKKTRILLGAHIVTSCRKFDRYGDWYLLRHPVRFLAMLLGREDRKLQDQLWYDFGR